jgi:mannose-6-phosphate isomerase-like protein (cupin superfamily)
MALERKKTLNVFKDAAGAWGSYDDYPVGPAGTDPMPHLSRNRVAQPFYLVSEADQVLIQMAGEGEIFFAERDPPRMALSPGDTVYIPAGVPSRLVPRGENLQVRLKAEPPVREAVAWYCRCGALVHAAELPAGEIPQEGYWRAVRTFNAEPAARTCGSCGEVHPLADLGDVAWPEVAAALRAEQG